MAKYEVASSAHIFAMLWPFASTGNLGIQLVLNLQWLLSVPGYWQPRTARFLKAS